MSSRVAAVSARVGVALGVLLVLTGCGVTPAPEGEVPASEDAGVWVNADPFPLEPRDSPVVVSTGEEVVVLGGALRTPCPPTADCGMGEILSDGAALDPEAGAWRPLASAPLPIAPGEGAFVDGRVFAWADGATARGPLMAYSIADDRWERIDAPDERYRVLVPDGDGLLLVLGSHEDGAAADYRLDLSTEEWEELPVDPLGLGFDRSVTSTPDALVLTSKELVTNPGADGPPLVRIALFDREEQTWRRLPDAPQIGGWRWSWTGERVVAAELGEADGGEIGGWDRSYPFGGRIELPEGTWSALPEGARLNSTAWVRSAVGGERYLIVDDNVLDDVEQTWMQLDRPTDAPDEAGPAVWVGDRLVVIGGTEWAGLEGSRDTRTWVLAAGG